MISLKHNPTRLLTDVLEAKSKIVLAGSTITPFIAGQDSPQDLSTEHGPPVLQQAPTAAPAGGGPEPTASQYRTVDIADAAHR